MYQVIKRDGKIVDFDISKIYPLVHVKVKGEDGDPVAWNRMAWFCTKQSVDVSPCLGHLGCDDDLYRCRYCGSTEDMGIVFVDCRYNLESSRDFSIGLEPGSSLKITSDIYVPENKYFIGWNTSKDGSGVWYQGKQLDQYAPCVNDDDLLLFLAKEV